LAACLPASIELLELADTGAAIKAVNFMMSSEAAASDADREANPKQILPLLLRHGNSLFGKCRDIAVSKAEFYPALWLQFFSGLWRLPMVSTCPICMFCKKSN
jgi:hypothetical protein